MESSARAYAPAEVAATDAGLLAATSMLLAAALVHLGQAPAHFTDWWVSGSLFGVAATLQVALAIELMRQPTQRVSAWVCAVNVGILAVWLLSRTVGLPLGPDAGAREPIGVLDLTTSVEEVLLVVLLATHAGWAPWRKRGRAAFYCQAAGTGLALLLTLAFASGLGHA